MDFEKSTIPAWLYVYKYFLIGLIVSPFMPLASFFYPRLLIFLIPFYIASLVLIYKKSKYAANVNKITLLITIFLEILTLYAILNSTSKVLKVIFNLVVIVNIVIIVSALVFLVYWQKSKQIKKIFVGSTMLAQAPSSLSAETLDTKSLDVQTNNQLNSRHLAFMNIISLISCGMFIFTGFGMLLIAPVSFVFSNFYSAIFKKALRKNSANTFAVYSVTFTLVCAYTSLFLNLGFLADEPDPAYLVPALLGVPSNSFVEVFGQLFIISLIYLLLSIPLNLFLIRNNGSKILFSLVPMIGLILIAIHWGIVWKQLPELKAQVVKERQEEIKKEQARQEEKWARIEESYNFNWSKINESTFKNRVYSIFTPPVPRTEIPISDCPYTMTFIEQGLAQENLIKKGFVQQGFDINCLNDALRPIGQVPITTKGNGFAVEIPNSSNVFKKGDVIVVVAELGNPSMMRIHANGNAAKDCACKMPPYDYSGIDDSIKIGTSTVIYERSVIQTEVTDKKRTIMILYPININGLKDIEIKLSPFSNNINIPVTLKEVAVLSPITPSPDPEWLKAWLQEPNPFLGK